MENQCLQRRLKVESWMNGPFSMAMLNYNAVISPDLQLLVVRNPVIDNLITHNKTFLPFGVFFFLGGGC